MNKYMVLSLALLLVTNLAQANITEKIVVTNKSDIDIVAHLNFKTPAQGKNQTTGTAAAVCVDSNGKPVGLIKAGKANTMSYNPCVAGKPLIIDITKSDPKSRTVTTIGSITIGANATGVIVDGKGGTYTVTADVKK